MIMSSLEDDGDDQEEEDEDDEIQAGIADQDIQDGESKPGSAKKESELAQLDKFHHEYKMKKEAVINLGEEEDESSGNQKSSL